MLQLKNRTPMALNMAVFPDPDGIDTVYATIKATFRTGAKPKLVDEQLPVRVADEFYGDPAATSLKYASEVHPSKAATDVVLVGQAWTMNGKPATRVDVRLMVAGLDQHIRVSGDRQWRPGFLFL